MIVRMADPVKYCGHCKERLYRKHRANGLLERRSAFVARLHCTKTCANRDRAATRIKDPVPVILPTRPAALIANDLVIPCREDPQLFDADWTNIGAPLHKALVEQAIGLCQGCPALQSCTIYALDNPGIFGVIAGRHRPWPNSSANHRVPS